MTERFGKIILCGITLYEFILFGAIGVLLQIAAPVYGELAPPAAGLSVQFSDVGISRLSYNGDLLFDAKTDPGGAFNVVEIMEEIGGKSVRAGGDQLLHTNSWDADHRTLTLSFRWGTVSVNYRLGVSQVGMAITLQNTTDDQTISGINCFPLALTFPKMPADLQGSPHVTFAYDGPALVLVHFTSGAVTVVDEDGQAPFYCGFLTDNQTAQTNRFPVWAATAPLSYMPTSWPVFDHPLPPHSSQTYHVSLRFGPPTATAAELAPDAFETFTEAHPYTVNWPDHRPIGMMFIAATGPQSQSATNPRGWFNNRAIDVITPAGIAEFHRGLLAFAERSIRIMKAADCQGMMTWDVEGEEYPDVTYAGDPRLATTLAPELKQDNLIDQYFQLFRKAGLRVGVTIRPQKIVFHNGRPSQEYLTDPNAEADLLVAKIQYAEEHWGCSMFYIDSTSANDSPTMLEQVHQRCPDVLLIPENANDSMYAVGAPFGSARSHRMATPPLIRELYPKAFNVIDTTTAPLEQEAPQLVQSVREGCILFFHGWIPEEGVAIRRIYREAASLTPPPPVR